MPSSSAPPRSAAQHARGMHAHTLPSCTPSSSCAFVGRHRRAQGGQPPGSCTPFALPTHTGQVATDVRKEVNNLDNLTTSKAVDALLNYETVTLFDNQALEVGRAGERCMGALHQSGARERCTALCAVSHGLHWGAAWVRCGGA